MLENGLPCISQSLLLRCVAVILRFAQAEICDHVKCPRAPRETSARAQWADKGHTPRTVEKAERHSVDAKFPHVDDVSPHSHSPTGLFLSSWLCRVWFLRAAFVSSQTWEHMPRAKQKHPRAAFSAQENQNMLGFAAFRHRRAENIQN